MDSWVGGTLYSPSCADPYYLLAAFPAFPLRSHHSAMPKLIIQLTQDMMMMKMLLGRMISGTDPEGELSDWAKAELASARADEPAGVPLEKLKAQILADGV